MKTNEVKKNAIEFLNAELCSPFAVLNAINKNRKAPEIVELFAAYGINKKLELSDLLGLYDYSDRNIFCKLQKINNKKDVAYCEYTQYKIGGSFFQVVPIKFTIKDFFASIEAANRLKKENEKQAAMYEKLFASAEKKAEKKESKAKASKAAKRAAKVDALVFQLTAANPDLTADKIREIAEQLAA